MEARYQLRHSPFAALTRAGGTQTAYRLPWGLRTSLTGPSGVAGLHTVIGGFGR